MSHKLRIMQTCRTQVTAEAGVSSRWHRSACRSSPGRRSYARHRTRPAALLAACDPPVWRCTCRVRFWLSSRNRDDIPQGVHSHETALSLHELSDAMPAKLHMTVPKTFRRMAPTPRPVVLHRSALDPADIETLERRACLMIGVDLLKSPRTYAALALFIAAAWLAYPYQKAFTYRWISGRWPTCPR